MTINKVVIEGIKNIEYGKAFFALLNNANLSALDSLIKPLGSTPKIISIYCKDIEIICIRKTY